MGHPMKRRRKKPEAFIIGAESKGSSPLDPPDVRAEKDRLIAEFIASRGVLKMINGSPQRVKRT